REQRVAWTGARPEAELDRLNGRTRLPGGEQPRARVEVEPHVVEAVDRRAFDLLTLQAEESQQRLVDVAHRLRLHVDDGREDEARLEQPRETRLRFAERFLGLAPLGDVALD